MTIKHYLSTVISFAAFSFSSLALAQQISIYDQPSPTAKVIGQIDLSSGVIPVYQPKDSPWVKVADPRNGNVGWAKMSDLKNAKGSSVTFTQKIINDGQGQHSYRVLDYGQPAQISNTANSNLPQSLPAAQQHIQKSIENLMDQMNSFYQQQWNAYKNVNNPSGNSQGPMPIVILPGNQNQMNQRPNPQQPSSIAPAPNTSMPSFTPQQSIPKQPLPNEVPSNNQGNNAPANNH